MKHQRRNSLIGIVINTMVLLGCCFSIGNTADFSILEPEAIIDAIRKDQMPYQADWQGAVPGVDFVANELIVGFDPERFSFNPEDPSTITRAQAARLHRELIRLGRKIVRRYGMEVIDTSPTLRAALFRKKSGRKKDIFDIAEKLKNSALVLFAEPNGILTASITEPDNDPTYTSQFWHYSYVGAQRAWDTLPRDFSVRIAVIDTGFRLDHPDVSINAIFSEDYDFVSPGALVQCNAPFSPLPRDWDLIGYDSDATDDMRLTKNTSAIPVCVNPVGKTSSHGTHVANTIASSWDNGVTGVGVFGRLAPDPANPSSLLNLIPVKAADTVGNFFSWDVAQAIQYTSGFWVSSGPLGSGQTRIRSVDIVNMSFGGPQFSITQWLAANFAWRKGVLLVASAGNDSTQSNASIPHFPAALNEVMAISNMNTDETLNTSSMTGPWIELTAPGTAISSNSFDYSSCNITPGISCTTLTGGLMTGDSTSPAILSGTSVAAPHVSGIAGLYLAHNPTWTNADIRRALQNNAADWGQPGQDDFFGFGLVQAAPGNAMQLVTKFELPHVYMINTTTRAQFVSGNFPKATTFVAPSSYRYSFINVPAGDYYILISSDEDGDGIFAETGEPVGAVGGVLQRPGVTRLTVDGNITGTFQMEEYGWPDHDPEPANDSSAGAGELFLDFYVVSTRDYQVDEDWYHVVAPYDGNYIFWTEGVNTNLCREELGEYDPILDLYDASNTLIATNDDVSPPNVDGRCAFIQTYLTAGDYYVRLTSNPAGTSPAPLGKKVILHFQ